MIATLTYQIEKHGPILQVVELKEVIIEMDPDLKAHVYWILLNSSVLKREKFVTVTQQIY
jgi:hypothetical protein